MKIDWSALVHNIVAKMKVGEIGYLHTWDIIITTRGELFLNLDAPVEKKADEDFIVPVERVSRRKDWYKIYLDWPYYFTPTMQIIDTSLPEYKSFIGPFPVATTQLSDINYYARFDTDSLLQIEALLKKEGWRDKELKIVRNIISSRQSN